jgi:predicted small secreted protein
MMKRTLAYGAAVFLSAALFTGCNDTVTAKDCSASCQDIDNNCVKKCNDDQCRMQCTTDLDNCTASCGTITVSPSGKDGG